MRHASTRSVRVLSVAPIAISIVFTSTLAGAAFFPIAAPAVSASALPLDPPQLDAATMVRTALDKIGGKSWDAITSYESVATVTSAMGDGRIEFQFVAPDARRLVQTMPGGKTALELGSVGSVAWMGEPGRTRAVDPRMAQELSGGGDLLTLVRSIDARFTDFTLLESAVVDGVRCTRVSMRPLQGPAADARWTLLLDAANATIVGLEIPAPKQELAPNAPVPDGQSIRFRRWEPVERPAADRAPAPNAPALLAFREATVVTAGMKVDLAYSKVAVDTLGKGSIAPPSLADAPAATQPAPK
jgi:hypothetical protein